MLASVGSLVQPNSWGMWEARSAGGLRLQPSGTAGFPPEISLG